MNPQQALAMIDNTVATIALSRRDHANLNAATQSLSNMINEHGAMKAQIEKLIATNESLVEENKAMAAVDDVPRLVAQPE